MIELVRIFSHGGSCASADQRDRNVFSCVSSFVYILVFAQVKMLLSLLLVSLMVLVFIFQNVHSIGNSLFHQSDTIDIYKMKL